MEGNAGMACQVSCRIAWEVDQPFFAARCQLLPFPYLTFTKSGLVLVARDADASRPLGCLISKVQQALHQHDPLDNRLCMPQYVQKLKPGS